MKQMSAWSKTKISMEAKKSKSRPDSPSAPIMVRNPKGEATMMSDE